MANTTPNLGLRQPEGTDPADVPSDLAQITGVLDDVVTVNAGRGFYVTLPAPGVDGRLYYAIDRGVLLRDDGASWETVAAVPQAASTVPASGNWDGRQIRYAADATHCWDLVYDGGRWNAVGGPPITRRVTTATITQTATNLTGTQITVPADGRYHVEWGWACVDAAATAGKGATCRINTDTGDLPGTELDVLGSTGTYRFHWSRSSAAELDLTSGDIRLAVQSDVGSWGLLDAYLSVTPVYLTV